MQQYRSRPAPDPDAVPQTLPALLRELAAGQAHQRAFTFVDYPELRSAGRSRTLTWAQMHERARAVAAQVRQVARPGERAVLLMPQGLDYVAGFLGCLTAGVVAVPLFPPDQPGHENRVAAVIEDCEPACALVTEAGAAAARAYLDGTEGGGARRTLPLVHVDAAEQPTSAVETTWDEPKPDELAYLQYTSGSTRTPAGVMITHRNIVENARQGLTALASLDSATTTVSWLPLFHDMGLVMSIGTPVVAGFPSVLMDPVAFLARPERWLRLLGSYPNVLSAAPNFAYDYCVTKVRPDAVADLRLDQVRALINGAEPVRPRTVRAFATAFAGTGLRLEVICPSYGLAEATVFVASDGPQAAAHEVVCERAALAEGRIVPAPQQEPDPTSDNRPTGEAAKGHSATQSGDGTDAGTSTTRTIGGTGTGSGAEARTGAGVGAGAGAGAGTAAAESAPALAGDSWTTLVACGVPVGQEVRVVEPGGLGVLPDGAVGEILVRGPNVGLGYWKRAEQSAEVFGAVLAGTGEQPWLRTGDLGALQDGRLLVTGRLKDLLIIDGRNHYPQDVEETVYAALDADRRERAAVFAVPGDEGEAVVAVAERRRDRMKKQARAAAAAAASALGDSSDSNGSNGSSGSADVGEHGENSALADHDELLSSFDHIVRARVAGTHGLRLDRLILVPPGTIPRTSSGKVSRSACRAAYLRGEYAEGHR